ncbi:MAG: arsenate reductase (glutaredoxin) [Undibacterium sp.]|uniref:arsenate reductase (glutaredoxin) n=1 Tax=Undibacterium sp. TaxID=1914977 RepID=UPI0027248DDC|nr:arsenate reductase (glutaredoxin) [Undibacterium sp.]MDO8652429.1 arsenate reductase (glutaredoxin) [Undibacterium sp.]
MMTTITIYHHPRCSKSRETLALVQDISVKNALPLTVVEYQKTPLNIAQLQVLQQQLGLSLRAMVRDNEDEYTALNLTHADDARLLAALASHPQLLQRPIVSYQGKAMIGRPPEQVLALFEERMKVTA